MNNVKVYFRDIKLSLRRGLQIMAIKLISDFFNPAVKHQIVSRHQPSLRNILKPLPENMSFFFYEESAPIFNMHQTCITKLKSNCLTESWELIQVKFLGGSLCSIEELRTQHKTIPLNIFVLFFITPQLNYRRQCYRK